MTDAEQKAIQEILDYVNSLPEPTKPSGDAPNDCYTNCHNAYDSCMGSAGSDLEKAACKAKYNKCISNC